MFRLFLTFPIFAGCVAAPDEGAPARGGTDDPSAPAHDTADEADTAAPVTATLAINELMADNESAWAGDDGTFPDWIELYNPTDADVDLLGWSITDDVTVPGMHRFTESLLVPAKGFVVLVADALPELGPTHLPFKLSADGEELALYSPEARRVEWIEFGEMLADVAGARVVDGSEDDGWAYVALGTPGASNAAGE